MWGWARIGTGLGARATGLWLAGALTGLVAWGGGGAADAAVAFSRPPNAAGGLLPSAWVDPDGSDSDVYAYDSFTVPADTSITEVRWRGGYVYGGTLLGGAKDVATDFRITFYASIAGNFQPQCGNPHLTETVFLADYWAGGNAGETPAGTVGGKEMFDYAYVLPTPFAAKGGTKYWLKIEASQAKYPDWGIAAGAREDGHYFRFYSGSMQFLWITGDTAFTLLAPGPDPFQVADVTRAMEIWAGFTTASADDLTRLDVVSEGASAGVIDAADAVRLARKAAGLDANP